jgi:hypothetical protein
MGNIGMGDAKIIFMYIFLFFSFLFKNFNLHFHYKFSNGIKANLLNWAQVEFSVHKPKNRVVSAIGAKSMHI